MWPYWLMFLLPASVALLVGRHHAQQSDGLPLPTSKALWALVWLWLTLLIGFRVEVGADWFAYLRNYESIRGLGFLDVLLESDPGYQLLNWVSNIFNWGIVGVNLIGASIFSIGLVVFCRSMPQPWLSLAVAVPYMVIVLAMGYSRQGIALGFAMLGLVVAAQRASPLRFVIWILLGALFHKTAILLLPIAAITATRNRIWTTSWVVAVAFLAYVVLLKDTTEFYYANYVEAEYQSEGAFIRLLMSALPAAILITLRNRFQFSEAETPLWLWFATISLCLLGLLFLTPTSTAIDRLALYMLPLQLVVFSRLPELLGRNHRYAMTAAVLLYYALVQFVWLNYATTAFAWDPYRFYPIEAW